MYPIWFRRVCRRWRRKRTHIEGGRHRQTQEASGKEKSVSVDSLDSSSSSSKNGRLRRKEDIQLKTVKDSQGVKDGEAEKPPPKILSLFSKTIPHGGLSGKMMMVIIISRRQGRGRKRSKMYSMHSFYILDFTRLRHSQPTSSKEKAIKTRKSRLVFLSPLLFIMWVLKDMHWERERRCGIWERYPPWKLGEERMQKMITFSPS